MAGDLKTFWTNPPMDAPSSAGDSVTKRGSDPNVDLGGPSGLKDMWTNPASPVPSGEETPNSVSGLPLQPSRLLPSETPPEPPSLDQRSKMTIDQQ